MAEGRKASVNIPSLDNMYHYWADYLREEVDDLKGNVTVESLSRFDQYHYLGVEAVSEAGKLLKVNSASHVLDVGAGCGGPARHLAKTFGCKVSGIEIQEEMVAEGKRLNEMVGLDQQVTVFRGDILNTNLGYGVYDAMMSFLVFLHIPEKFSAFSNCLRSLKRGSGICVEDFYMKDSFTDVEAKHLEETVSCRKLPTREEYIDILTRAGFVNIKFTDMTKAWTKFVSERVKHFKVDKERNVRVHGARQEACHEHFVETIESLFKGGHLGGVRITATKRSDVNEDAIPNPVPHHGIQSLVKQWLQEDMPSFDIGGAVVGTEMRSAVLKGKSNSVLCGQKFFNGVFSELNCKVEWKFEEGERFVPVSELAIVTGRACDILAGERTALNALTRATSIATRAREIKDKLVQAGWQGAMAGTRKTTPGFRLLEKYAMMVGGADTHRYDLSSMVMLKDNHVNSVGSIAAAVMKCKQMSGFSVKIEVECGSVEDALEALASGADVVMLDNFKPPDLRTASQTVREEYPHAIIEASGGITANTVVDFAAPCVDVISLGALTQGVPSADISLKILPTKSK